MPRADNALSCCVVLLIVFSVFSLGSAPFAVSHGSAPRIRAGAGTSLNWSGYAVSASTGSVTDVKGSWIVASVTCSSTNTYAAFWTGIDGYSSSTVEQTGTDSDCQNGSPTYYAWYEFYPKPAFLINSITVHPGDVISAEVQFSGGTFTATIIDLTTAQSFTTSAKVGSAQRSSAEWIAEAPSSGGTILPLSNFATASFGYDYTSVASTSYATISGSTGPISSFGASVQQITMVDSSGSTLAQPSAVSADYTSFTVAYSPGTSASPDFSLSASPSSLSIQQGGSTSSTITVTSLNGFSSAVSLSLSGAPTGVSGSFNPNPVTPPAGGSASSTLSISVASSTATGSYALTVTGGSGSLTHSVTLTLTVSSTSTATLSVSVTTDKSSYTQNSWAYITVTVTANGVPVSGVSATLTVTDPNGAAAQGSGTTNANGQVIFKYRIGPNAPLGTYTATAQASGTGYNPGTGSTTFTVT